MFHMTKSRVFVIAKKRAMSQIILMR